MIHKRTVMSPLCHVKMPPGQTSGERSNVCRFDGGGAGEGGHQALGLVESSQESLVDLVELSDP